MLLGRQHGLQLEIVNSIELKWKEDGKKAIIDEKFAQDRLKNYKEMFKDLDVIGWYTAMGSTNSKKPLAGMEKADKPTEDDMQTTCEIISKFCENPLLLLVNPHSEVAAAKRKIPYFIYEVVQGTKEFIQLDYLMASSDAEQIAVDGCARAVDPDAKISAASQGMVNSMNAVQMLRGKINFIINVVQNEPSVRQNQDFMRRLNQIVKSTPITAASDFDKQSYTEFADLQTLALMANVTKSCGQLQELINDFKIIQKDDRHQMMGRRGMGMR
jgi:hypothetical protein